MKTIYCLLIIILWCSCNETSEIGAGFFKEGNLGLNYTDTLTLKVSTVTADSIVTGAATRLLVGNHVDDDLGKITTAAYFQITPQSTNSEGVVNGYSLEDIATDYVRTSLVLWHDTYSYYDTSDYQTIYVHQLQEEISTAEDGNLYNTTNTVYDPTASGYLTFKPKPNQTEPIEIPLTDAVGKTIYDDAVLGLEALATATTFNENYLIGFVLKPDVNESKAVLGFNTSAELRIYYLDRSVVPSEEKYLTYFVSSTRYNKISTERGSSALATMSNSREAVSSTLTNRKSYIQGGSGLSMRIEVPYLRSILLDNDNLVLTQAILSVKPVKEAEDVNTSLPQLLKLYAVNKRNEIYADLLSTEDEERYVTLTVDTDLERETNYSADVSGFIKSQLQIEEFNNNAMLLSLNASEYATTVNRLYAGDQNNKYEMKLTLHFAYVR
ncbi:MAG: hypothetical protein EBR30_08625 [Cytophagia bacterium]|nr:hypothetical protein [Cytophagia bacterium]